jgi:hypothetical protein
MRELMPRSQVVSEAISLYVCDHCDERRWFAGGEHVSSELAQRLARLVTRHRTS